MYDSWVAYRRRRAAGIFDDFTEGHKKPWDQFDEYDSQEHAMTFEDRSQEETERQHRCARGNSWTFAKHIKKLREKDKATFFAPTDE